jgi:hypothetical protein
MNGERLHDETVSLSPAGGPSERPPTAKAEGDLSERMKRVGERAYP